MEKEIWKDVEGYEGLYEVSSYGRVKSLEKVVNYTNGRRHLRKERIIKPSTSAKTKDGKRYLCVTLSKNAEKERILLHRLVAKTFIPNPDNLPIINHKDENPSNNHVENLEWCTQSYNINYGTRNEKVAAYFSKSVLQLDMKTEKTIAEYKSLTELERQKGFYTGFISACCNGKRKTAYSFKWRYKE